MIALKRILVATDFSEPSGVAVGYGRDLARAYGATLHVVHVMEDMMAFYGGDVGFATVDIERNIEAAVQDQLDTIARQAGGAGRIVVSVQRGPNAANAITEYARAKGIDLVIVGTHGRGLVSRFFVGSVAERVVRQAPCPVLTVRAHERDFVAVDEQQTREPAHIASAIANAP